MEFTRYRTHHASDFRGQRQSKADSDPFERNSGHDSKGTDVPTWRAAGSASEVLKKLEQAGLISRIPSENDHRTTNIRLTPDGETLADEANSQRVKRHEQMFSVLSVEEKDTLITLLEKVNAHWDQTYRRHEGE